MADPFTVADPAIDRSLVDGVPTYSTTGPTIQYTGALMFRVGRSDERLPNSGITHLVEHLALFSLGGRQTFQYNGFVEGARTVFVATGQPAEVREYLMGVCATLRALPIARLRQEAHVLRSEAAQRSTGAIENHLWHRYGPCGHGIVAVREFGLERPDEDLVRGWAAEYFTRDNATAWFSGPVPADMHFDLPSGTRRPVVERQPIQGLRTPSYFKGPTGGMSASFVTPRVAWFGMILGIVQARLQQQLRYEKGLTYSIQVGGQWLDSESSHSVLGIQSADDHATAVLEDLLSAFYLMSTQGAREAEIERQVAEFVRAHAHPGAIFGHLESMATDELIGFVYKPPSVLLAELTAMTAASTAGAMEVAIGSTILQEPTGRQINFPGYQPYPVWSSAQVPGKRFKLANASQWPFSPKSVELFVGPEGVSIVHPDGNIVTVRYVACELVAQMPDRALILFGSDGFNIRVVPAIWWGGLEAWNTIRKAVPSEKLIEVTT